MKLLHWATVSPQGPSGLSAVRFSVPIRVSLIRIFPSGARPFDLCPDIVAQTEPESFYLDIFFNAQPLKPAESKDKQRAPNALVPTSVAYAGGQAEFTVDLGTEYATRLMIIKGKFDSVSLAVYGEVVTEVQSSTGTPEPMPPVSIPQSEPIPVSRPLDVANASEPTLLAQKLLSLTPNPPSLSLATRLVLCMKPETDDWEDPDFPYLHADLEKELSSGGLSLESAVECLSRPIPEDTPKEVMADFWEAVASDIQPQTSTRQSSLVAQLFKISASQHPAFALELCLRVDAATVFDSQSLDYDTLCDLLDAAANADIARHFHAQPFLDTLQALQDNSPRGSSIQKVARRLSSRIQTWEIFEDSLSNTQADVGASIEMLKDIGSEEQSLGIWVASMTLHDDLVTKLSENPSNLGRYPAILEGVTSSPVPHDNFIAFVRAYIGIASVFAAWSWADSLGNDLCRERILATLRLWQGVDGYHELVNYLLVLRQFSLRLKWIASDNETPRKSGMLGEQILADLVKNPSAVLHDDVNRTVLGLEEPFCSITEADLLLIRKLAYVAEDGLPAAIEEIFFTSARPLSIRRLRTLRLSLAMVDRELEDGDQGEWRVIETVRDNYPAPLLPRLVQLLQDVSSDLNEHFVVTQCPPAAINPPLVEHLFRISEELIRIIKRLSAKFSLNAVVLRAMTLAVADTFVCTDAADTVFFPSSAVCSAASVARDACLDIAKHMAGVDFRVEPHMFGAEVVFRTLLNHATGGGKRDPVDHLQQIFSLLNHTLPTTKAENGSHTEWLCSVLPAIQTEISEFFRLLDLEHKIPFIERLVELDHEGLVGLAEWLLAEELQHLLSALRGLASGENNRMATLTLGHEVHLQLQFLEKLSRPRSDLASWFSNLLSPTSVAPDIPRDVANVLLEGVARRLRSVALDVWARFLAQITSLHPNVKFATLVASLSIAQRDVDLVQWADIADLLSDLPSPTSSEAVSIFRQETGLFFSSMSRKDAPLPSTCAVAIMKLAEWIVAQEDRKLLQIIGCKAEDLSQLFDKLASSLPDDSEKISTLRSKFSVDEDELILGSDLTMAAMIQVSIQDLESLLKAEDTEMDARPSTPTRTNVPDVLGLVFSPPAALLRSPAATGLTKTYLNNDFRDLRQVPAARQNTSRLPSTHVDVGINGQWT